MPLRRRRLDGSAVMEMDVGNNRDRALAQISFSAGAVLIRTGDADNVGTASSRSGDLRHRPLTSVVSVLVMVCTEIGASPPTGTEPTMICRHLRRSIVL